MVFFSSCKIWTRQGPLLLHVMQNGRQKTQDRELQVQTSHCIQNEFAYSPDIGCPILFSTLLYSLDYYPYLLWSFSWPISSPFLVPPNSIKFLLCFFWVITFLPSFLSMSTSYTLNNSKYSYWALRLHSTTIAIKFRGRNVFESHSFQFHLQGQYLRQPSCISMLYFQLKWRRMKTATII